MEAVYILWTVIEKSREKKGDLHMVFVHLEKAYDTTWRSNLMGSREEICS